MIRTVLIAVLAMIVGMSQAVAQFPERPITVVVGASAGGGTDIQTRIMAERLSQILGQQVLVDNKPGAGSNIATAFVANADPDGYTLTMIAPAVPINHTLYANPGFDATKDFAPVAGWAQAPLMFVVHPSLPVSTLKELADYSKEHPGELDYGNGVGFINQMVMELYKLEAGADIQFVPYKGMAPARTDVVGGQIETTVDSLASSGAFIEAGELKALATTAKERLERFPDVPTVAEAGYPNVTRNTWYGLMAPAGTPDDVVATLAAAVAQMQGEPEVVEKIAAAGASPLIAGPADFTSFINGEIETWGKVIEAAKMDKVR